MAKSDLMAKKLTGTLRPRSPISTKIGERGLNFTKADNQSVETLQGFFNRYPSRSCDFSVGGVLMWADLFDYHYAIFRDCLILKGRMAETGRIFFHIPVGNILREDYLFTLRHYCEDNGIINAIILIPEEATLENNYSEIEKTEYAESWKEYLYDIGNFINFPGKKMEKKRNHLHYFYNHYSEILIEPINDTNTKELMEFTLKFEVAHSYSDLGDYENEMVLNSLKDYSIYPYFGILIRVEGKIVGFTFGESIGDTFVIHVEKGDTTYNGVYQALSSAFAERIFSLYPETKYLNREDDMGVESIRKSKESYHPSLYIRKRVVSI